MDESTKYKMELIKRSTISGLINEIKINKNEIISIDPSSICLSIAKIVDKYKFEDVFCIMKANELINSCNDFDNMKLLENRLIFSDASNNKNLQWLIQDENILPNNPIPNIKYNESNYLKVDKGKLTEIKNSMKLNISNVVKFITEPMNETNNKLMLIIGEKTENIFSLKLLDLSKDINIDVSFSKEYLKSILESLSDNEIYIYLENDKPLKIEQKNDVITIEIYLAPRAE